MKKETDPIDNPWKNDKCELNNLPSNNIKYLSLGCCGKIVSVTLLADSKKFKHYFCEMHFADHRCLAYKNIIEVIKKSHLEYEGSIIIK